MSIKRRLKDLEDVYKEGRQKIECKDGESFWVDNREAVAASAEAMQYCAGMYDSKDELSEDTLRFLNAKEGKSSLADYVRMLIENRAEENVWEDEKTD